MNNQGLVRLLTMTNGPSCYLQKFFFQVCLTEVLPFDEMRRKVINGRKKPKADILAGSTSSVIIIVCRGWTDLLTSYSVKASAAEDDIQLGSTKVSLKDPVRCELVCV